MARLLSHRKTERALFNFYNLAWKFAIPLLRHNSRLAEGFEQRTLQSPLLPPAALWIQSASVGEAFLACELLKNLNPGHPASVLLTSNTRQGVEVLQRFAESKAEYACDLKLTVSYFPFDQPDIMRKAVEAIQPKVTVLLETEIWPGLLAALKAANRHAVIINGRISAKSLRRYRLWPAIWPQLKPDRILAISENDAKRFAKLFGMPAVAVMPNIKFDRLQPIQSDAAAENPIKKLLHSNTPFVVLASVRQKEEAAIGKIIGHIRKRYPVSVIGLVPRHRHRIEYWQTTLKRMAIPWRLRSETTKPAAEGSVILWDTFGELPLIYELATAAFVGGSLAPLGGQNFLEALMGGVIPVIGPFWDNFAWVGKKIADQKLVKVASDWKHAAELLAADIQKPPLRNDVRRKALRYMKDRRGGAAQACQLIEDYLNR